MPAPSWIPTIEALNGLGTVTARANADLAAAMPTHLVERLALVHSGERLVFVPRRPLTGHPDTYVTATFRTKDTYELVYVRRGVLVRADRATAAIRVEILRSYLTGVVRDLDAELAAASEGPPPSAGADPSSAAPGTPDAPEGWSSPM